MTINGVTLSKAGGETAADDDGLEGMRYRRAFPSLKTATSAPMESVCVCVWDTRLHLVLCL